MLYFFPVLGIELTKEALVDSWNAFDAVEYSSIVAITVVMTFYGMTAGLALGVLCATLTFTIQVSMLLRCFCIFTV